MQGAIDNLYAAFRVPKPREIEGCPCCIDRKDICTLLSKSIETLTADDLGPYAASVFLTVGDNSDFQYFLPRIFEISAIDLGWYPTPEIVLGKLKLASWSTWKENQQAAVTGFIEAWFEQSMEGNDSHELDSVLCGIGRAGIDLKPFLRKLAKSPIALKGFFELSSHDLYLSNRLTNPFWRDAERAEELVVTFLQSPEVTLKVSQSD